MSRRIKTIPRDRHQILSFLLNVKCLPTEGMKIKKQYSCYHSASVRWPKKWEYQTSPNTEDIVRPQGLTKVPGFLWIMWTTLAMASYFKSNALGKTSLSLEIETQHSGSAKCLPFHHQSIHSALNFWTDILLCLWKNLDFTAQVNKSSGAQFDPHAIPHSRNEIAVYIMNSFFCFSFPKLYGQGKVKYFT